MTRLLALLAAIPFAGILALACWPAIPVLGLLAVMLGLRLVDGGRRS